MQGTKRTRRCREPGEAGNQEMQGTRRTKRCREPGEPGERVKNRGTMRIRIKENPEKIVR